ncbi:MAG: 3',5'-cyclic-AMP phosphodiesterase [Parahaliea sp.]
MEASVIDIDVPVAEAPLRILQISDCHLSGHAGGCLLGLDTDRTLQAVIRQVQRDKWQPDLLLVTGDLADAGATAAYSRLHTCLTAVCPRQYWLPGNHDNRQAMLACGSDLLPFCIRAGRWQIILLDSQVPGEIGGEIGSDQLAALAVALNDGAALGLFSLICMHHQPVPIGCAWLDEQRIVDADALFSVIEGYSGVRALLWGHIHQEVDRWHGQCRLLASPSTCVQFMPGSEDFQADPQPPGYRWLQLYPDGRLKTAVQRVQGEAFEVNLKQRGYLKKEASSREKPDDR